MSKEFEEEKHPNAAVFEELCKGVERKPCGCRIIDGEKIVDCGKHGDGRHA